MRKILVPLCLTICSFIFGQEEEESIYFPQEQIILTNCSTITDTNECLTTYFEELASTTLREKKALKLISKLKKDTVFVGARLVFNPNQTLDKEKSNGWVSGKKLKEKLDSQIASIFLNLPIEKIINQKAPHESYHNFSYKYLIQKNGKEITLTYVPDEEKYTGGIVENFPVFPGCENLYNNETRKCFNKQMQAHIGENFRYPKQAQKKKIQGRVSIIFKINEEGIVSNIRKRGPNEILEEEAVRIIKLIPKCKPGLKNGVPTKFSYSIPITFKLQ